MGRGDLVLGLLEAPAGPDDPLSRKLRDLTIAWSRYGYRDSIIERPSVDAILDEAASRGHRTCLILSPGVLIRESWRGDGATDRDFLGALLDWSEKTEFLAAGRDRAEAGTSRGLDTRALVVDVRRWQALGRPGLGDADAGARVPPVQALDRDLSRQLLDLAPTAAAAECLAPHLGGDGAGHRDGRDTAPLLPDQRELLDVVALHTKNARRGVFLWNIESYGDVEEPPPDFRGPVSRLYSVAAGFKPNRILQTHGFEAATVVVFFDYSPNALAVRRFAREHWDGRDYPAFLARVFERFPHPDTHYHLWGDRTPAQVSGAELEAAWSRELHRWSGEEAFARHWNACRELDHEFVLCDVLEDPAPLLGRMEADPSAVIWWSNAFFTVIANWQAGWGRRRDRYEAWVSQLAERNPMLLVYGSDHNNTNVNWIRAGEYWSRYRELLGDELVPRKLQRHEIRM